MSNDNAQLSSDGLDGSFAVRVLRSFSKLGAVGLVIATVLSFLPVVPFGLFDHFRFQLALVGAVGLLIVIGVRRWGVFDAVLIATLLNAAPVIADLSRVRREVPAGTPVRILEINVHKMGSSFEQVRSLINDVSPAVLALIEVDERWLSELAPALSAFSIGKQSPRSDNFGIALFSKFPANVEVVEYAEGFPSVVAVLDIPVQNAGLGSATQRLQITAVHPPPPITNGLDDIQASVLDSVARSVQHSDGNNGALHVVVGDYNATPWSSAIRRFRRATALCDSRSGFGLQTTFPASMPSLLRIPIDHAFLSCELGVAARRVERDVGSDHLPVVIDIVVPFAN
jgi:endonuclease/exonuclease/phosphatase (EEP) superfamily protein YafD